MLNENCEMLTSSFFARLKKTFFYFYFFRVGRTARAGRSGISVSLACESERKLVKEIVKKAERPVKSRIIPPQILLKYKKKVEELGEDVDKVLKEELEERLLQKAEMQMNAMEKKLKSNDDNNDYDKTREWFQTKKQRSDEKSNCDNLHDKTQSSPPTSPPHHVAQFILIINFLFFIFRKIEKKT